MSIDPSQVAKSIKAAKPTPISFAIGAATGKNILLAERGKSSDQLAALVKKEPGVKQVIGGSVSFDGQAAVFVADKQAQGLQKMVDDWCRQNKVALKANVMSAHDAADAGDDEDEEETPALFTAKEIEKRLKVAKSKPVNFAFALGGGKEKNLLGLHMKRDGHKIFQAARKENGATKSSIGYVEVTGVLAQFHCEDKPLPGLKKMLLKMFKEEKIPYKVAIFAPEGEVNEPGDDDEAEGSENEVEQTTSNTPQADTPPTDGVTEQLAALRGQLQRMMPALQQIAQKVPPRANAIRDQYRLFETAQKSNDVANARTAIEQLQHIGHAGQADVQALAEMRTTLDGLMPRLREVAGGGGVTANIMRNEYAACDNALKAGDPMAARAPLAQLRTLAGVTAPPETQEASETAEAESSQGSSDTDTPTTPVSDEELRERWRAARASWQDAIETIDSQIKVLQKVLRGSGDEELEAIAEFGLNGVTGNFRVPLMASMMDLDRASGEDFKRGAARALGIVANFKRHIETDEIVGAVDDNPFDVDVGIRTTLGGALTEIEDVLKAA
jgi:hypothetical protein